MICGPVIAAICLFSLPHAYLGTTNEVVQLSPAGRATMAMLVWMALWWLTEAVPIYVTALLPLALFPLAGVASMNEAARPYAHPLIFLFMGGFLLALSMERWGLGKRIALTVLFAVGSNPIWIVGGFMFTTALLSAFVSNTATTAMMLPIALSVIGLVRPSSDPTLTGEQIAANHTSISNLSTCLMLGIAYAGSIGGIATVIGSPPNSFLVSFLHDGIADPYRQDFSFVRWLAIGVPLSVVFLPIVLVLLTKVLFPIRLSSLPGVEQMIRREVRSLGPANRGEWATFLVFVATAVCWIVRPLINNIVFNLGDEPWRPLAGLTDPGIAMTGALLLFVIPENVKTRTFVMDWETAIKLPWGILILFGGGLSLAAAITNNGVAEFIASYSRVLQSLPEIVVVLLITTIVVFLTELTSNTATTATLVPILAALAPGIGVHPYLLVFPAAIAASFAFMLPVATPPNAIVFGSGMVTIRQMAKAGFWLNIIGILLVTVVTMLIIRPLVIPG